VSLYHNKGPDPIGHGKYSDRFDVDSVPESERKETARQVADMILAELQAVPSEESDFIKA